MDRSESYVCLYCSPRPQDRIGLESCSDVNKARPLKAKAKATFPRPSHNAKGINLKLVPYHQELPQVSIVST